MAASYVPRKKHSVEPLLRLSGLEPLNYMPDPEHMRSTFLNIGERCNVAGSSIYKKAIVDGNYDKAASIAVAQVGVLSEQVVNFVPALELAAEEGSKHMGCALVQQCISFLALG